MEMQVNEKPVRAVVAAVQLQDVPDSEFEASLTELRELAKTLGFEVVGTFTQKRANFDAAAYLGLGKRQEMRRFVEGGTSEDGGAVPDGGNVRKAAKSGAARAKEAAQSAADPETRHADVVLVDHEISPSQARNLEIEVGCEVMDRTMVILEIFHRHARSSFLENEIKLLAGLGTEFDAVAEQQSKRLVDAHERFSALMDRQRFQVVYPVLPMDLVGVYVLLPD
jgi:GTP-binding protein HflX